eukprot:4905842-Prymnesium_polylepis.1
MARRHEPRLPTYAQEFRGPHARLSVLRQASSSWHPRDHPASLSTGNRLRAHEVPSVDLRRRSRRSQGFR